MINIAGVLLIIIALVVRGILCTLLGENFFYNGAFGLILTNVIIVLAIVGLVLNFLYYKRKRKTEPTDKGFELFYDNLSNRRKFIRTLWLFPFMVVTALLVHWRFSNMITTIVLSIAMFATWIGQAVVTYRSWKKEEDAQE